MLHEFENIMHEEGIMCMKSAPWASRNMKNVSGASWNMIRCFIKHEKMHQVHWEIWRMHHLHHETWKIFQVHHETWKCYHVHHKTWWMYEMHHENRKMRLKQLETWRRYHVHPVTWRMHPETWKMYQVHYEYRKIFIFILNFKCKLEQMNIN